MNREAILYPVFAMFLLVSLVLLRMRSMRFAAVRQREIPVEYYRAFQDATEPEPLRVVARHFANLFEMPVLFYVTAVLIYVTYQTTAWLVALAWLYVTLRYVHTWIHLGRNDVIARFSAYFGSFAVLVLMWVTLLVQLLRS